MLAMRFHLTVDFDTRLEPYDSSDAIRASRWEAMEPILESLRSAATRVQLDGVECALSLPEE